MAPDTMRDMRTLLNLLLLALLLVSSIGCEKTIHEARGPHVHPEQLASRK
jgi:hypothetical protein